MTKTAMALACNAPHRLPDDYYDRLEQMEPEEAAVTFIGEVLADDHPCGDPAISTVEHKGRKIPVCHYHLEWFNANLGVLRSN